MIDAVLRHCADSKKRRLSVLPNVGHQVVKQSSYSPGVAQRVPGS